MFIVSCEVFPYDILVCFGESGKRLFKELGHYIGKSEIKELKRLNFRSGKSIMFSGGQTLLWLKEKPKNVSGLAILSHEIFHCTCFILEKVGIPLSETSDEAYAYLLQFISNKIYNELGITFS